MSALTDAFPYWGRSHECPNGPHRGPEGPNEDIAQCGLCLSLTHSMRPVGETFHDHAADCSLPIDHASYCLHGGAGHPASPHRRGYFPPLT